MGGGPPCGRRREAFVTVTRTRRLNEGYVMTRKIWPMLLALFTAVGLASMPALGAAEAQHPLHHG